MKCYCERQERQQHSLVKCKCCNLPFYLLAKTNSKFYFLKHSQRMPINFIFEFNYASQCYLCLKL